MILAGIHKSSLVDYPGAISCVIFALGCNFRCPYCHNPSLVLPQKRGKPRLIEEEALMRFLHRRKGLLDGVVISGGEPTLQKDLIRFCRRVKQLGYPLKLDTNGSRPRVLASLIEKDLVDYIAMDIKTLPEHYGTYMSHKLDAQTLVDSIRTIMTSGKPYEFRTTCAKPMVNHEIMHKIGRLIENAALYVLQPYVPGDILEPGFFKGDGKSLYCENEMIHFQKIAGKYVRECNVRL